MQAVTVENPAGENPIGRFAVIEHDGKCYVGNVLDCVAGTNIPKRIRIQFDVHLQGKVVMPGQYTFKQFSDETDY
jgi:hypothetical protein